jgi:protein KRI1
LKREEVNRLKTLKMREIREKIDRVQKEGGVGIEGKVLKVLENDIDEDWDPEKHDSTMRQLYEDGGTYAVDASELHSGQCSRFLTLC